MAIVTDPDNLDRNQVIYGTNDELLSLYPVGALTDATATGADGVTVNGTKNFTSATALFTTTNDVNPGDILSIFNGTDAGHYIVDTVDSATQLTLIHTGNFAPGDTDQEYDIREPTGGSIEDGVTEQALYSFSKEEWKTDGETYGSDDLIRHEFPYEAITPQQFEIGGLLPHSTWDYFDDFTKKKVRHGGWEHIDTGGTTINIYCGMVSLGDMDADAQPYYQNDTITTDPIDFEFLGPVNEAVFVWDSGDDFTTYFKAFLRKKGKTYSSYDLLTEQPALGSLANRREQFPLSHIDDPAISSEDGELVGFTPWSNGSTADSGSNGVTTVSTSTFTSAAQDFLTTVTVGDVLYISSVSNDNGYFLITDVVDDTELTVDTWELSGGVFAGDTVLDYTIATRNIIADPVTPRTDGSLNDVDGDTGTIDSAGAGFNGIVNADDLLVIVEAASDHRGVYKVISVTDDDTLVINTEDRIFTTVGSIDFYIVEPSMYFQYKWEEITLAATGDLTFANADPDTIYRASGTWNGDGVSVGDVIVISGTTNNNGSYTVAIVGTDTMTLVGTDSLTAEGPLACTKNVYQGFTRELNGVFYAFKWMLLANGGDLNECFEFHQHQMRQATDVAWDKEIYRGDITDLMLSFVDPNAVTTSLIIDDLDSADANNVTYYDATGVARSEKYIAAGSINFNSNLEDDGVAIYHMFFLNDDAGDDNGYDYGTPEAITVKDNAVADIKGTISAPSVAFSYDYDNNVQRGSGSDNKPAPVVVVCIGLTKATFVRTDYTITRIKTNTITCVAALERNYAT